MKLPTPEACTQLTQWLRGATEGQCALKHFKRSGGKSGGQCFAHFKCRVCKDEFNQAADSLSDGIPIKLQEWAAQHTHQPPAVEEILETVFEPGVNLKPKKAKAPKAVKPKPLPTYRGRKFRE